MLSIVGVLSTVRGVQYSGGYYEYLGGTIKGRYIGESVHLISDILEYTDNNFVLSGF